MAALLVDPINAIRHGGYQTFNNGIAFNPIENDVEKTYFFRIMSMVMDLGRELIKDYVLNTAIANGSRMEDVLRIHKMKFKKLVKDKKLSSIKIDILFPPDGGPVNRDSIDLGLWYVIARNISPGFKWGKYEKTLPEPHETDCRHDVVRVRNTRNILAHSQSASLTRQEYKRMWDEISGALYRAGFHQETINHYRTCDLDTNTTNQMYLTLKEDALRETEVLYQKEIGKKTYMIIGFVIILLVTISGMCGILFVLYKQWGTWNSCSVHMEQLQMPQGGGNIWFMSRAGWGALPMERRGQPRPIRPRNLTVIASTEQIGSCTTTDDCCRTLLNVQKFNMQEGFADIVFSFMVGGDGVIYEGRGFDEVPATAQHFNLQSLSLAFVGEFSSILPSVDALTVARQFLQYMASKEIMTTNFTIYGLCQLRPYPYSPGRKLMNEIENWNATYPGYSWTWRPLDGYCE